VSETPIHVPKKEDKPTEATALDALGKRLRLAQERGAKAPPGESPGNAFGLALRLVTELVAGVVVGGSIGWTFDKWLGTGPYMLLVFFILGSGAGLVNVVRTARMMNANGAAEHDGDNGNERAETGDE